MFQSLLFWIRLVGFQAATVGFQDLQVSIPVVLDSPRRLGILRRPGIGLAVFQSLLFWIRLVGIMLPISVEFAVSYAFFQVVIFGTLDSSNLTTEAENGSPEWS